MSKQLVYKKEIIKNKILDKILKIEQENKRRTEEDNILSQKESRLINHIKENLTNSAIKLSRCIKQDHYQSDHKKRENFGLASRNISSITFERHQSINDYLQGAQNRALRSVAIVSSKVIQMIAQAQKQDQGVLAERVKRISVDYFHNLSKFQQLSKLQVCHLMMHFDSTISINDLKYFFCFQPNEFFRSAKKKSLISKNVLEKLKKIEPKAEIKEITQEEINEVRQLFTSGIQLPSCYTGQQRVMKAAKIKTKKVVFNPTYVTTTYLFNHLLTTIDSFFLQLISGKQGTGKTMSFILYCLLMDKVAQYAITISDKTEIQNLVNQKLLIQPKKPFYWSFDSKSDQEESIKNLQDQCKQIEQIITGVKFHQQQLCNFSRNVRQFYKAKGIRTVAIIDQINVLASMYRKQLRDQNREKKPSANLLKLNDLRKNVQQIGIHAIYNSSVNIEKNLVSKNTDYPFNLEIQVHIQLKFFNIPYRSRMKEEKSINEIMANFRFQAKIRNFQISNNQEIQIKKFIQQSNCRYILTPLRACQIIQTALKSQKSVISQLHEAKEKFLKDHKNSCNQFILKTLDLNDENEKAAFAQIIVRFRKLFRHQKQLQIKNDQVFQLIRDLVPKEKANQIAYTGIFFDKNIFQQEDNKWKWIGPLQHFEQYAEQIIRSYLMVQGASIVLSRSAFGSLFEILFYDIIFKNVITKNKKDVIIKYGSQSHNIKEFTNFIEFNYNKYYQESQDHMDKILKSAKTTNGSVFAIPYKRSLLSKRSQNSFCVDFCITKYNKDNDNYEIIFYDMKTEDLLKVLSKEKDVKQFKMRFNKKMKVEYKGKYTLRVLVLCLQNNIRREQTEKLSFQLYDIFSVQLLNIDQKSRQDYLKYKETLKEKIKKDQQEKKHMKI